ncbi:hypothetical protein CMK11_15300 [Candidatus Poribacteria bacterium]|nr:hypothetical protein [Candidatus Poribacteria bacterium]
MTSELSDRRLVRRCVDGDRDAFAELARRYEGRVYAIAYARTLDSVASQDVTQDALLTAYVKLRSLREPDRFGAWISRIAFSRSQDHLRHARWETPVDHRDAMKDEPASSIPQEESGRREDIAGLTRDALRALPEMLRVPVVMRHMDGASIPEIAESLAISPKNARRRLERGMAALRRYFERSGKAALAEDVLASHGLAFPVSADLVGRLMGSVSTREMHAGPSVTDRSLVFRCLTAGFAGTCALVVMLSGLEIVSANARDSQAAPVAMPVALLGQAASIVGVTARLDASVPFPAGMRVLVDETFDGLTPGQPVPGWTAGVYAQVDDVAPGGGSGAALVNTNIPSAYYRFPLTRGRLTVDVWVKPRVGDTANCNLRVGNHLAGWKASDTSVQQSRPADGEAVTAVCLAMKTDADIWFYYRDHKDGGPMIAHPFARYAGEWRRIQATYDTTTNTYDLDVDGRAVAREVPTTVDLSAGISWVGISSGRWHREADEAAYIDDLRVYVEPPLGAGRG